MGFGLLERDWRLALSELVARADVSLLVAAPFISSEGSELFVERLSPQLKASGRLNLLTDLSPAHVCDGSLEPSALRTMIDSVPCANLWHIPRLHAKVYVADSTRAIVTSGNLTASALRRNLEYGVEIRDASTVSAILSHFEDFQSTGTMVSREKLGNYVDATARVRDAFVRQRQAVSKAARAAFEEALRDTEDDLMRLRLAGGAVHTVFARSIEYVLRKHGPMSTDQIHGFVQHLHPDLCDDSVDRVIDGQSYGKKWKHAVRTAQQALKSKGLIAYSNGQWRAEAASAS